MGFNLTITAESAAQFKDEIDGLLLMFTRKPGPGGDAAPSAVEQPVAPTSGSGGAAVEVPSPKRTRKPSEPKPEPEVAEKAPEGEAGPNTAGEASDTKSETASEDTSSEASDAPTVGEIRELVLQVVDLCGRERMEEIVAQFGVERATQVPVEQRGELMSIMREALAEKAA